jgi:mitochondrial fusion and transport protein UGO1
MTGFILSPLDLIRTRLIVQSSVPQHRSYTGPVHAFRTILETEGGLYNMYFHPTLFVPTILDSSVRTLLSLSGPLLIARTLVISEDTHPVSYSLAELTCSSASLLVSLPIETIRRRLQVQSRGGRPIEACVETRPVPYAGFMDALWRIVTEEQSTPPKRRRRKSFKAKEKENLASGGSASSSGWFQATGIAQLYRGFGMGVSANALVFVLAFLTSGGDNSDAGWAEL